METLNREELKGITDRYLDALGGHAPNRLPLAGHVTYTENGQRLELGDGLWGTATRIGKYRIDIIDTRWQAVGYLGIVFEQQAPCCFATRLKLEDGHISEIETIVAHPNFSGGAGGLNGAQGLEDKGAPHPAFTEKLSSADKRSRAELIAAANSYFSGLEGNTGHYPVAFTEDCQRIENGVQTTGNPEFGAARERERGRSDAPNIIGMSPDAQLKSGYFAFVTAIRNRRHAVVDEDYGNVLSFVFFDHHGRLETLRLTTGQTIPSPLRSPFTWEIAELFKVKAGKLRQIEAVLNGVPYGMKSAVWDE
jgi:hypothetical protein